MIRFQLDEVYENFDPPYPVLRMISDKPFCGAKYSELLQRNILIEGAYYLGNHYTATKKDFIQAAWLVWWTQHDQF